MTAFHEKRRQQFLTEGYYLNQVQRRDRLVGEFTHELELPETDLEGKSLLRASLAEDYYERFSLRYTAGEPLDVLREELTGVVEAYERYQQALSLYEEEADTAVFYFREMVHYSRLMQLIGLAYLFHRRDLLARIAALADTNFYGQDALYEELLDYALPDRVDTDQLFHARPYEHLVHAMYRDTDEESIEDLQKYVQAWYPAMKHVPWHDGHLRMTDTDGDYFGYWAFEAGAVALLLDIDDSSIDHMVYPKDLVAYARKLRDDGLTSPSADSRRLRGLPNELVPKTGWWWSPAFTGADALRHFNQGEHFPSTETTGYGGVFWYYDADRQPKE